MLVKRNIKMTLWERIYLFEVIRGLWITSSHLLSNLIGFIILPFSKNKQKPIFTVYYPEERVELPDSFRGRPALVQEDNGTERCVACGLCEIHCPAHCIEITASETADEKERYPEYFSIDFARCIMCGFCEEVCPKDAIVMSDEFELAVYDRKKLLYKKEQLLIKVDQLQKQLRYIKKAYK